jgi:hypothetical protein
LGKLLFAFLFAAAAVTKDGRVETDSAGRSGGEVEVDAAVEAEVDAAVKAADGRSGGDLRLTPSRRSVQR